MTAAEATLAGLLRAVLLEPGRDDVRLVYADALEERGGPGGVEQAEFVRVQLELAREKFIDNPGCPCSRCQRGAALRRRERALLGGPACRRCGWHAPLPHGGCSWELRRGLVESVALPCAAFLKHAAALFSAQPVLRVELSGKWPDERPAGFWQWYRRPAGGADLASALPEALWRGEHLNVTTFASSQLAVGWLSQKCVAHGRAEAVRLGLVPDGFWGIKKTGRPLGGARHD